MYLVSPQEEQAAKLKAEKIRVALEKIKEAQVKKVNYLHFFMIFFFNIYFVHLENAGRILLICVLLHLRTPKENKNTVMF